MLSEWFDTVEINVSFYRPLPRNHAESWLKKVAANDRFKFTAKLWQRFTHERESEPSEEDARVVREGFEPLVREGRLGAVLAQFPWSFKRTPENRLWLSRVLEIFSEYPLSLEIRHASWDRPEVYEGLRQRGVAFCNIDQPIFHDSLTPTDKTTSRVGYIRLHGRNHDDWFREDAGRNDRYDYLYSEDELKPWVEKIERIRQAADEIYVITNNHYRGQAVVNAFELQHELGRTQFVIPKHILDEYPHMKRMFGGDQKLSDGC